MHFIILHYNNSVILCQSKVNTKSVNNYYTMGISYKMSSKEKPPSYAYRHGSPLVRRRYRFSLFHHTVTDRIGIMPPFRLIALEAMLFHHAFQKLRVFGGG